MKKITLTINGKEQTLTEGSVVEVVFERDIDTPTFDFEGEGYDDIPHISIFKKVGYLYSATKEKLELADFHLKRFGQKNYELCDVEVVYRNEIISIKELK